MNGPAQLRKWRTDSGFTLEKVAGELGVSIPTVSGWELGKTAPRISHALKIARITNGLVPIGAWEEEPANDNAKPDPSPQHAEPEPPATEPG